MDYPQRGHAHRNGPLYYESWSPFNHVLKWLFLDDETRRL